MDLSDPKVWTDGIKVVVNAPHIVGPLMAATAIAVWWFRGTVEKARQDGLQSTIDGRDSQIAGKDVLVTVMQERLQLANDAQKNLTTKLTDAEKETEKLRKQVEEKASPEAIAATARHTATLVTDSVSANTQLKNVLSNNPADLYLRSSRKSGDSKPPSVTAPSE